MLQGNIGPEHYVLLVGAVIALIVAAANSGRVSASTMRKLIDEYDDFIYQGNELIRDIGNILDWIKDRYFVSVTDRNAVISLIERYNALHDELFAYNEQMEAALKKKKVKNYKKYKKQAVVLFLCVLASSVYSCQN